MKAAFTLTLLLCMQLITVGAQQLFKIVQNDSVGYINEKGEIVIKPVYLSGNDFSEGLAAVRPNGLYGFIDAAGKFIIEPQYDFATNFYKGIAVVYKHGQPYFINKEGETILPSVYVALVFINEKTAVAITRDKRQGVIDIPSKRLIIDTVFGSISNFVSGVAIADEYIPPSKKRKEARITIIDTSGKFIVPLGKYKTIKPFVEGYAIVEITDRKNKDGSDDGVIDTKGNLLFRRPHINNSWIEGDFHDGYAKINLYKYWLPEEKSVSFSSEKCYEGFINLKGEVVFSDTNCIRAENFSNGRAFVKNRNDNYILLDRSFKRIGDKDFIDVVNEGFKDGSAIVNTTDGYGIIDTIGNFIVQPRGDEIEGVSIVDGYYFFTKNRYADEKHFGIADLQGKIISTPLFTDFDRDGFVNGLLKVIIQNRLAFINKQGQVIWQQPNDTVGKLTRLNIDFMNRGYFYAYSTPATPGDDDSGGWAVSPNTPKKILAHQFPDNVLAITIDTSKLDTFGNKYAGYKLFISNNTSDTIKFDAQDSRLYLKLQAQDDNEEWKDIEYLPNSWCGNSYHTIKLEPNAFWNFTIPNYMGEFKTKIRAALTLVKNWKKKQQEKIIYSNVINGSINPGQFWNKRTYYPSGLMDSYLD